MPRFGGPRKRCATTILPGPAEAGHYVGAAMMPTRLERIIGFVLRTGVLVSTVGLGVGLVLSFLGTGPIALIVLDIGVIVLLATPVVRVVVSIVEYANERDWAFVGLTAIVLVVLAASAVAALVFNRRL